MAEPFSIGGSIVATVGGILKGFSGGNKPVAATQEQIDAATKTLDETVRANREGTALEDFKGVGLGSFLRFLPPPGSTPGPEAPPTDMPPRPTQPAPTQPRPFPPGMDVPSQPDIPSRAPPQPPGRPELPRGRIPRLPKDIRIEIGARVLGKIFEVIREPQREVERQRRERIRKERERQKERELDKRKREILRELETKPKPDVVGRPENRPKPEQPGRDPAFDPLPGVQERPPGRQRTREPVRPPGRTQPVPGFGVPGTLRAPGSIFRLGRTRQTSRQRARIPQPRPDLLPPVASPVPPTVASPLAPTISPTIRSRSRQRDRCPPCEKKGRRKPRTTCKEGLFFERQTKTDFDDFRTVDCITRKETAISREANNLRRRQQRARAREEGAPGPGRPLGRRDSFKRKPRTKK